MTNPTIKLNAPFPPALEQTLRLALEHGLISDKAQARAAGTQPGSIRNRWDRIADRLALPYGQRERAQVVVALVRSRTVEYLMVAICIYTATLSGTGDIIRPPRPTRAPVVVLVRPHKPGRDGLADDTWGNLLRAAA